MTGWRRQRFTTKRAPLRRVDWPALAAEQIVHRVQGEELAAHEALAAFLQKVFPQELLHRR